MSKLLWTIHNNRTLVTIDDLSTEEALSILRAEQPNDLQYWFAWREGMPSWNPVVTVVELDLNAPGSPRAKPLPPQQLTFDLGDTEARQDVDSNFEIYWMSETDSELEKADWSVEEPIREGKPILSVVERAELDVPTVPLKTAQTIVDKDRRKYPRFDVRFKVVIQNENITFRTYSRNASLGGLALEVAIPPILIGQSCLIHVTANQSKETIRLPGRLVANRDQTRYFSFFRASAESISKLQKWLETHSAIKKVS